MHGELLRRIEEDLEDLRWFYDPENRFERARSIDRLNFPYPAAAVLPRGPFASIAVYWWRDKEIRRCEVLANSWAATLTLLSNRAENLAKTIDQQGSFAFIK